MASGLLGAGPRGAQAFSRKGTVSWSLPISEQVPGRPVIAQVTRNGATAHLDHDPTGHPVQLRTSTGQDLLYVYDNIGSPVALITNFNTTAFQYSFDPYGVAEVDQTSGGNAIAQTPFLHTGGLHDRTTGWIKQGARYYNPTEGRWTQHDTLDAPLDPLNANRYAYAANNPTNYTDPRGLAVWASLTAAVSGFGSVADLAMLGVVSQDPTLEGAVAWSAGALTGAACYTGAAAAGGATGGAGLAIAAGCELAGYAAGQLVLSLT